MRLLQYMAGAVFILGTLLTACTGKSGSTPPVNTWNLQVSITIPNGATSVGSQAKSAYVYVYDDGAFDTPPPSSLAGVVDLSASSKDCSVTGTGRKCSTNVKPAQIGSVAVHVDFYDQQPSASVLPGENLTSTQIQPASSSVPAGKKLASTHTTQTLTGNDTYPMVTDTAVAQLVMSLSRQYFVGAADFHVSLQPMDSAGNVIVMPGEVAVYGPAGAVTASATAQSSAPPVISDGVTTDTTNGAAPFHYSGAAFVNPMTVVGVAGTFSQTAQIFPSNPASTDPTCPRPYPAGSPPTLDETNVFSGTNAGAYDVGFSIGSSTSRKAQIDTGSELLIIEPSDVAGSSPSELLGPGEPGYEELSSDGNWYAGHYYLARVTLRQIDGTVVGKTVPMKVLVEDVACGNGCYTLMGVGFGRPVSTPGPYGPTYKSPLMNTLLQQNAIVTGTDLFAGYKLTKSLLQVGLTASNTRDFTAGNFQQLTPFSSNGSSAATLNRLGDWNSPNGCVSFNGAACVQGGLLIDVGIRYMILNGFGSGAANANNISLSFLGANGTNSAVAAATLPFKPIYGGPSPPSVEATPPAPAYVNLRNGSSSPDINTGIHPLYGMDYLYDEVCGRAGFRST
jgi:hypothetical protein